MWVATENEALECRCLDGAERRVDRVLLFDLSRTYPEFRSVRRAISVPQRSRIGHHRATQVGLGNTAELVFDLSTQVRKSPKSVSQAENAGSIPVTRSKKFETQSSS